MSDTQPVAFKRVMLKISGEALMGDQGFGLHPPTVERIANEIQSVHAMGVEICLVIGGGNIFRGLQGSAQGMEREKKRICIFAAGTGNPYFTTDTAATLRASEMACEAIFKGTKVDGVYDKDPAKHADAKRYKTITYDEVLAQHLGVMDASAIALARENSLPIIVFSLDADGGFKGILDGTGTCTTVKD